MININSSVEKHPVYIRSYLNGADEEVGCLSSCDSAVGVYQTEKVWKHCYGDTKIVPQRYF